MKKLGFEQNGIAVRASEGKGRGVFATKDFKEDDLIECAPIIVIPEKEWPFVSSTMLSDYFFETESDQAAIALGNASLYNHSFEANAEYLVADDRILITAFCDIKKGQEICIDYGWEAYHYYENGIITKEELEKALEEEEDEDDT